jgi:ectoine hydroxylase-related dioxygenase (phytanoyl-CoA dioxygenase family)
MASLPLTPEQLSEYQETGLLVVENILTEDEVTSIRTQFHQHLHELGMNHEKLLSGQESTQSGPRLKSDVATIFYPKWKLDAHMDARLYACAHQLLTQTYGCKAEDFDHPFESFDQILTYIDRVCYRLPDHIRAEGGLEMHIDRNPTDPYLLNSTGLKKWRPIQAILTLTDHYGSDCGGLKVVKGFHTRMADYFEGQTFEGGGEFTRLTSKSHSALAKTLETVQAPKGSLIFWDNRLPHATCAHLIGSDTREVIYTGFLPNIKLNRDYCLQQLVNLRANRHPPAYCKDPKAKADRDWKENDLTDLQRQLLYF